MDLKLFIADVESHFDQQRRDEHDEMLADMLDAERGGISYAERLLACVNQELELVLRGGQRVKGKVDEVALQWMRLSDKVAQHLIPIPAIIAATGLGAVAPNADAATLRVSITHVLRELSARGVPLVIDHDAGQHVGRLLAVYADHCDLLVGDRDSWDQRDRGPTSTVSLSLLGVQKITLTAQW